MNMSSKRGHLQVEQPQILNWAQQTRQISGGAQLISFLLTPQPLSPHIPPSGAGILYAEGCNLRTRPAGSCWSAGSGAASKTNTSAGSTCSPLPALTAFPIQGLGSLAGFCCDGLRLCRADSKAELALLQQPLPDAHTNLAFPLPTSPPLLKLKGVQPRASYETPQRWSMQLLGLGKPGQEYESPDSLGINQLGIN